MAADRAADGIEAVKARLQTLRDALGSAGLTIDPVSNKVVAGSSFNGTAAQLLAKQAEFQPQLDAILGEATDWRMAEALDPHTYDPRYRGLESNVVVGKFNPIPGAGVYRQNMYIPGAEVQNFEFNDRANPHMVGDNRGPSVRRCQIYLSRGPRKCLTDYPHRRPASFRPSRYR